MQALGNDFVVINACNQMVDLQLEHIKKLADRRLGIGFDQLLLLEPATIAGTDFNYRIFNADGTEVAQCGNGARAMGLFIAHNQLAPGFSWRLSTQTRVMTVSVDGEQIAVNMGMPEFAPEAIPMLAEQQQAMYRLSVDGMSFQIAALSVGNPHAVYRVSDVAVANVAEVGALLTKHRAFPQGANIEFVQVLDNDHIALRVYERGVGETQACGSGACAAVVAARANGWLTADTVQVSLLGGDLSVKWCGDDEPVWLVGDAAMVFTGEIDLDA